MKMDIHFQPKNENESQQTNGHGMTAKTALMRSVSRLKPHQIMLMCCCTVAIIHTYLLTAVPS